MHDLGQLAFNQELPHANQLNEFQASLDFTDQHLVLWYFEDWLKKYFFSILQILESLSLDPLAYVRMQTLSLLFTLLRDKPEQEQNLLRLLVNKLVNRLVIMLLNLNIIIS